MESEQEVYVHSVIQGQAASKLWIQDSHPHSLIIEPELLATIQHCITSKLVVYLEFIHEKTELPEKWLAK